MLSFGGLDDAVWDLYWAIRYVPEKRVLWTWERLLLKTVDIGETLWYLNLNTIKN